ncbi:vinorine synthase-like [Neltuma alba]|uniref:vinorine synthase-like n=1 Tax=Neltuma alba TaxID=207710 RepID=UPI0010A55517|nr:vinorine synthase-like [Prosopis alba]
MVKPSSPTPQHLRHYHLSFLDQLSMQINNSMVYFFNADDVANKFKINEASHVLKKSLSQVLTHFYPLAGRLITDKLLVDCNDEGVPYAETRVRCRLCDVIDNPSPADVNKLLPYDMDEIVDTVLGVQFNVFDCGGIAVGVCVSHKVGDALSFFQFIKAWAAMTRGQPEPIKTHFQSFSLFPPKDMSGSDPNSAIGKHKIVGKRFVFEPSVIESLRTEYSRMVKESQKPPSRIEALSTFIFNRIIAATKENEEVNKKNHLVTFVMNIRPRMEPPLPEFAFGNYYLYSEAFPTLNEKGECNDLGRHLREELNKVDKDFIMKLREREGLSTLPKIEEIDKAVEKGEIVRFHFTSICRFPVYEVDFGWGNPTWAGPPTWKFKNVIIFKDTKSGGGIEAYVNLTEEDMAKFERDEEFLAHVSTQGLK